MRQGVVVAVAVVGLAVSAPAAALLPEQVVRATPKAEVEPSAARLLDGSRVLAWTEWRGRTYWQGLDAYLKVGDAAPFRLNRSGFAEAGGIDVPWAAYSVVRNGQSDIRLYNVDTGVRSRPPGVNTPDWESSATLSGDWILFERYRVEQNTVEEEQVVLVNRTTLEERILDEVEPLEGGCCSLRPGQVAGDYAVWHRCGSHRCNAFRYRISTGTTDLLTLPSATGRRQQYAPSVTPAGVVYVLRSDRNRGCGDLGLRLVRYFGAADPASGKVIAARSPGTVASRTFALAGPSATGIYLDREAGCVLRGSLVAPSDLTRVVDPG
jgi:hypothetical protein